MSESSGGQALKEAPVSGHQVEVRLLFQSSDNTLPQLSRRIQDVEALMNLLIQSRAVLHPHRAIGNRRQAAIGRFLGKRGVRSRKALPAALGNEHLRGFRVIASNIGGTGVNTRMFRTMPSAKIRVETVSLSSPLEIVLLVSGPIAVLTAVAKLLPKFIAVKNDWNESRVTRAESNLKVERLKLEQKVVKLIAAEVENIDMDTYYSLPENHPSKKVVKHGVQALSALDKAEVRK